MISVVSLLLLFEFFPCGALAQLSTVKTQVGGGAEYELSLNGSTSTVAMYFAKDPASEKKAVEMYFRASGFAGPIEMWQRFHLSQKGSGPLNVEEGFLHSRQFGTRKLDAEYLSGFDGVQVSQFLITSEADLQKHFIGKEKVKVKAGEVTAHHYRVERAGQTVDFWIHHESKPIGLVKLVSDGTTAKQKYQMGLTRLLSGVKEKIKPSEAKPMDAATRSFLPKPNGKSQGFNFL